jgi:hypothetical protein
MITDLRKSTSRSVAFYVLGALFTLYVVAATWRSKDASSQARRDIPRPRPVGVDRRLNQTPTNGVPDQRAPAKTEDD